MKKLRTVPGLLAMFLGNGLSVGGAWAVLRYGPAGGLEAGALTVLAAIPLLLGSATVLVAGARTVPDLRPRDGRDAVRKPQPAPENAPPAGTDPGLHPLPQAPAQPQAFV